MLNATEDTTDTRDRAARPTDRGGAFNGIFDSVPIGGNGENKVDKEKKKASPVVDEEDQPDPTPIEGEYSAPSPCTSEEGC